MTTRREFCARLAALAAFAPSVMATGCAPGAVPVAFGGDRCEECGRTIEDKRLAAQAADRDGRVYKFDSVECLAEWLVRHPDGRIVSTWVVDFEHPLYMIPAATALYLQLTEPDSATHLAAFTPGSRVVARRWPGSDAPIRWERLRAEAAARVAEPASGAFGQ